MKYSQRGHACISTSLYLYMYVYFWGHSFWCNNMVVIRNHAVFLSIRKWEVSNLRMVMGLLPGITPQLCWPLSNKWNILGYGIKYQSNKTFSELLGVLPLWYISDSSAENWLRLLQVLNLSHTEIYSWQFMECLFKDRCLKIHTGSSALCAVFQGGIPFSHVIAFWNLLSNSHLQFLHSFMCIYIIYDVDFGIQFTHLLDLISLLQCSQFLYILRIIGTHECSKVEQR